MSALSPNERQLCFSAAPRPLAALFSPDRMPDRTIAFYRALGAEANPARLLGIAEAAGCRIALPHVTGRIAPMRFLAWRSGDRLATGPFGLEQPDASATPVSPDVVIVPLVGFDRRCQRLGQGAGHYDRALSLLPNALRIGLAWSVQEVDEVPVDPWDEPLDAILTEREWIEP